MEKKETDHISEIVILSSDSEKEEEKDETEEEECNDGDDESFQPDEADQSTESGRQNQTRKKIVKKATTNPEDSANMGRARNYIQNLISQAKDAPNAGNDSDDAEDEGISIEVVSEKQGQMEWKFENVEMEENSQPDEEEKDQTEGDKDEEWQHQRRMHKMFKKLRFDKPGTSSKLALASHFAKNIENGESIATGRAKRKRTTRNPSYSEMSAARKLRHNGKGHLVLPNGGTYDLCDCLDKDCFGCNYPCSKCDSRKCSFECRRNRRTYIESIEVLGGEEIFNPFLHKK